MKCLEMRAHGHANRGNAYAMQMTWKMIRKHANGISALKCGGKQPRNGAKVHPKHGKVPKYESWHPKWPTAMPNMQNWYMECK
ncbi:hypothetical protein HYC85_029919 [Camellia sinensis]|uniref:Uncharacterized protein n=1 Tax=Camellia sinensis TaxID=4442 RepID=A0A7J7G1Y0_CAMSI|nr:hypothetical protein HYC85_029919 [Camellia sinensis]